MTMRLRCRRVGTASVRLSSKAHQFQSGVFKISRIFKQWRVRSRLVRETSGSFWIGIKLFDILSLFRSTLEPLLLLADHCSTLNFLNEHAPMLIEWDFNGSQKTALRVWKKRKMAHPPIFSAKGFQLVCPRIAQTRRAARKYADLNKPEML